MNTRSSNKSPSAPFKGKSIRRVDWRDFDHVFRASVRWEEVEGRDNFDWYLIRDVTLKQLNPGTRSQWAEDGGIDEDDVEENERRYDEIESLLSSGEDPWPVIVSETGFVLDGYHRLAVMNDLGMKRVDVLWPRKKS